MPREPDETESIILKAQRGELTPRELAMIGLQDDTKRVITGIIETSPALEDAILELANLCYRDGALSIMPEPTVRMPEQEPDMEDGPVCIVCKQVHDDKQIVSIFGTDLVDFKLIPGHEYVIHTKTPAQRYERKWRMGFLGANGYLLQFSARGPDRTHGEQYGGTQNIPISTIRSGREVRRDDKRRYVGQAVR